MATKKKNENGNENKKNNENGPEVAPKWDALPEEAVTEVDVTAVKVPGSADARELLVTARVVMAKIPIPRAGAVEDACSALAETCDAVAWALAHNGEVNAAAAFELGDARLGVMGALAPITGILGALRGARVLELQEESRKLERELFGDEFDPSQLSSRALYSVVEEMELKLEASTSRRARLVGLMPEGLLTQLYTAKARLGTELGIDGTTTFEPRASVQVLRATMKERLGHLVKVLAATAVLGDRKTAQAVRQQLQPVLDLAAAVAPRKRAVAEAEVVTSPEPKPTPAVPGEGADDTD